MSKQKRPDMSAISRRDFVNGSLVGAGAALLGAGAPLATASGPSEAAVGVFNDSWSGYGGVGDYARSNGNVKAVRENAHLIRDGHSTAMLQSVEDTKEEYDLIVVGGGFSGIGAAYQFSKKQGDKRRCLILENHSIFGGEAKQNEFEVDGYRLFAPQGSNDFGPPAKDEEGLIADIYRDTGLPFEYHFIKPSEQTTSVKAPLENYYGIFWEETRYDTGYFMGANADSPWVINPRRDDLVKMPWSGEFKAEMNRAFADRENPYEGDDHDRWLDSMSYKDLLEGVLGYSAGVTDYFDPILAISMGGVGADVYSAYSAKLLEMPGTDSRYTYDPDEESAYSFPGGNSGLFRHIVKYLIPASITGSAEFEDVLYNPIDFEALDRPENPVSIRLNATVIDVSHDDIANSSGHVNVCYYHQGKVKRVRAKSVVMAIGGWVARKVVSDMPVPIQQAYQQFHHSPILVANVAVRNWRFLEKLGISQARWFEGFGNFFSIRRPMDTGDATQPFHPDKPIVLTFYVPFNNPGLPPEQQGSVGRMEMLSKSYADYEREITQQLTTMFASAGFVAEDDIAGIILNRWGHAYIAPQPGFHFGRDDQEAPRDVVKRGFGRIHFGHSELSGYMSHTRALIEGARAAQAAEQVS